MSAPMRAAIYVRKSTTHGLDAEFNSLDNQTDSCRSFIKAKGWAEVQTQYRDGGYSGGSVERPAFKRLLADAAAGKLDVIMVHRLDRFSRSVADFARLLDDLKKLGVAVVSVTEGFDTSTAAGTLMINIIISMAQWEREAASERLRAKFVAARRKGLWTGGRPPLGYRAENKRLVIDEDEANAVRFAFAEAARGLGYTDIARAMHDRGWKTRRGCEWTRQRLQAVLSNRIYLGQIRAGEDWVEGVHEGLVELEVFEQAQRETKKRARRSRRSDSKVLLAGLIRCGECGTRWRGRSRQRKSGVQLVYYCGSESRVGARGCTAKRIPAEVLDDFVVDHIRARIDDGLAGDVLVAMESRIEADRRELTRQRASLEQQIAAAERDTRQLAGGLAAADNAAGRAILQAQLDEAGVRHTDARLAVSDLDACLADLDATRVDAQWLTEVLSEWDRLWALLTPENRHRLMQAVVREIRINEQQGVVEVDLIDFTKPEESAA